MFSSFSVLDIRVLKLTDFSVQVECLCSILPPAGVLLGVASTHINLKYDRIAICSIGSWRAFTRYGNNFKSHSIDTCVGKGVCAYHCTL
jgi:NAD-dependent dihydropyrimidine dehydrogenase PreA subunit